MNKAYLTLLEQAIMLLFLSLACAISLQVFAYTANAASEARTEQQAMVQLANAAEALQAAGGDYSQASDILSGSLEDDSLVIYYDEYWNKVSGKDPKFTVVISASQTDGALGSAEIKAYTEDGTEIDSLNISWQEVMQ